MPPLLRDPEERNLPTPVFDGLTMTPDAVEFTMRYLQHVCHGEVNVSWRLRRLAATANPRFETPHGWRQVVVGYANQVLGLSLQIEGLFALLRATYPDVDDTPHFLKLMWAAKSRMSRFVLLAMDLVEQASREAQERQEARSRRWSV